MRRLPWSREGLFLVLEGLVLATLAAHPGRLWLLPAAGVLLACAGLWLGRFRVIPALAGACLAGIWLGWGRSQAPAAMGAALPVAAALLGIAFLFLSILRDLGPVAERRSGDRAARFVTAFHFIAAGAFFADFRGFFPVPLPFAWVTALVCLAIAADLVLHAIVRVYTPAEEVHRHSRLFEPATEKDSPATAPGLAEMWMWPQIRPWLPSLGGLVVLLFWLSTALHQIESGSQGVRSRFGRMGREGLAPGLHVSLPWPFGAVATVATAKPRETVLGFRSDPGQPILWERVHYIGEEMSLVGGGDDFLSISVPIFYHIGQPADFLRSAADPDPLLRELANRALLQLTVHRPAGEIMTASREPIRAALRESIQRELDARSTGLVVDEVYLRDIHPPVAVAPVYQEVVSAIEEKEATVHESEQYRLDRLLTAKGEAAQTILRAESAAAARQLQARGQAGRFGSESRGRALAPTLFDTREGYRVFDATLAGAKKIITDDAFSNGAPLHLDLRRVLNRNLIDHSTPPVEPLIPNPAERRDAFDLNVEGYR